MRVLVVDDQDLNGQCVGDIVRFVFKERNDIDILNVVSYRMALLNLKKEYDLVLCDHFLGDGIGSDFTDKYAELWPSCKIIRYSASHNEANLYGNTKCYDITSLQNELFIWKSSMNIQEVKESDDNKYELIEIKNIDLPKQPEVQYKDDSMKSYIPLVGVVISIIMFGVAYGQLIQKVNNTDGSFNAHCIKQEQTTKETTTTLEYLKIQNALIVDQNNRTQKDIEEIKKMIQAFRR